MTDPLDAIQNRLRWINRGILLAAILVLAGLSALAIRTLQGPKTQTKVETVNLPSVAAHRASAALASAQASAPPQALESRPSGPVPDQSHALPSAPASRPGSAPSLAAPPSASGASSPEREGPPGAAQADHQARPAESAKPASTASAGPSAKKARTQSAFEHAPMAEPKVPGHHKARLAPTCEQVGWYVQVGAFAEDVRFERLRSRLTHEGFATCKAPQTPRRLSLLLVGAYPTRERANLARIRLEKLLGSASYLRHLPAPKHAP